MPRYEFRAEMECPYQIRDPAIRVLDILFLTCYNADIESKRAFVRRRVFPESVHRSTCTDENHFHTATDESKVATLPEIQ